VVVTWADVLLEGWTEVLVLMAEEEPGVVLDDSELEVAELVADAVVVDLGLNGDLAELMDESHSKAG
jgi:hypothetical protein